MFAPSIYQQNIFDWIDNGKGNAVVQAVAGSGKTTTLLQAAARLKTTNAVFVAFNRIIADELGVRLKALGSGMGATTIHSLGKTIIQDHLGVSRLNVVGNKYMRACRAYLERKEQQKGQYAGLARKLAKLINFTQLTLTEPTRENLEKIVDHY